MGRFVWVATVSLAGVSCVAGCTRPEAKVGMAGESDVVTFSDNLEHDSPQIVDNWQARVLKVGCTNVERRNENLVVARCSLIDGRVVPIAFVKQGLEITIGCKSVSLVECKRLASEIVKSGSSGSSGSGEEVVIVMTKQIPSPKVGSELVGRWAKAAEAAGCKPTVIKPDIAIYDCTEGKAGALVKIANGATWFGLGCFSMGKDKCQMLHKRIIEEGAGGKPPDEGTTF